MKLFSLILTTLIITAPLDARALSRKNTAAAASACIGVVGLAIAGIYAYNYLTKKQTDEKAKTLLIGMLDFKLFCAHTDALVFAEALSEETQEKFKPISLLTRKKLNPDDNKQLNQLLDHIDKIESVIKIAFEKHKKELLRDIESKRQKIIKLNHKFQIYCRKQSLNPETDCLPIEGEILRRELYLCILLLVQQNIKI